MLQGDAAKAKVSPTRYACRKPESPLIAPQRPQIGYLTTDTDICFLVQKRAGNKHSMTAAVGRHACNGAGAATLRMSKSRDGSLRGRTSSRLRPMAMATRATAIGKPLPICPYVLPRSDENTPSTARVVARPSENETALQHHKLFTHLIGPACLCCCRPGCLPSGD